MVKRLETIFRGQVNEQLSVINIKVVFNSSIFPDDLTKGCCVEENRRGPKTEP